MNALIRKTFAPVIKAVGDRVLRFVISTGTRDLEGDTIDPRGWDVTQFLKNPRVFWMHKTQELPVAKALAVWVEGRQLISDAEFPLPEIYPFGDQVFKLLKNGYLEAASVGFQPDEWSQRSDGVDFVRQTLREWSVVGIPANSEALLVGRGANVSALNKWLGGADDAVVLRLVDEDDDDQPIVFAADAIAAIRATNARQTQRQIGDPMEPAMVKAALLDAVRLSMRETLRPIVEDTLRLMRGRVD